MLKSISDHLEEGKKGHLYAFPGVTEVEKFINLKKIKMLNRRHAHGHTNTQTQAQRWRVKVLTAFLF